MKKQGAERRIHSHEFKAEAVAPADRSEKPVSQMAVDIALVFT